MVMDSILSLDRIDTEVIIGLVGAVGSDLAVLNNILTSELKDVFDFEVVKIKVSADILQHHPIKKNVKDLDLSGGFGRARSLMDIGNLLRREYGNEYLALEIASIIKEKRKFFRDSSKSKRFAYIIDSLKNDAEIDALRQIYGSSFFQISLYESPKNRLDVLVNKVGMSDLEARKLIERDEKENEKWGQKTTVAFPLADYFIKSDNKTSTHIKSACNRFLKLIFGHPYITPTFNEFAIYMAFTSSLKSADLSRQVGAVIAKDENILARGANDVPKFGGGVYSPEYNEETGEVYDIPNGRDYKRNKEQNSVEKYNIIKKLESELFSELEVFFEDDTVFSRQKKARISEILNGSRIKDITEYGRMVHAEMDAILNCARTNNSTQDAKLYVTTFPCHNCAKHIVAAGIKEVVFVEPYPKSKALDFHDDSISMENDLNKVRFKPFLELVLEAF